MKQAPILILGVGNPSRGDDALGPLFVDALRERLEARGLAGQADFSIDFQLQIEHVLELEGRERVLFVDASVDAPPPCALRPAGLAAAGVSTHALSPGALLSAAEGLIARAPEAWVLGIRGERFGLGEPLSPAARRHLEAALILVEAWLFPDGARHGWRLELDGVVQGVGLRSWASRRARALGLDGRVLNTGRGLAWEISGYQHQLISLYQTLHDDLPPGAALESVGILATDPAERPGFTVEPSEEAGAEARLALAPDTGVCAECLAEVAAPGRYHGYPLTSCASCGPRYAITTALPWDRANTTLADWPLCPACAAAYTDPADRRYHAQGVACADCGPPVWLVAPDGRRREAADPLAALAAAIRGGAIAAVQGIGAFHLICDATDPAVVSELRRRKRRETQPFAVMVADLEAARTLAELDAEAEALLASPARPIVLLPSRGRLPAVVAPRTRRVGLMLPYTALHGMLLDLVGRPLVVTSANLSGQPAVIDPDQALRALAGVADLLCLNGRRIARRVEDSVRTTGPLGPSFIRRSRGYAPRAIMLGRAAPEPVLALGGHLKTAPAVVVEDRAFVAPHLGDLESAEAEDAFVEEVEALERMLGLRCALVAHDLHPDYASTRYALARGGRTVGVQHHAAHVLSVLAEHRLDEPVIGLALDGTGWGPDGTSWGTELLVVEGARWRRLASARPLPLPGGERAIRQPWRAALGALWDAFGEEALDLASRLPLFAAVPAPELAGVLTMLRTGTNSPGARGLGRSFDAAAALTLDLPRAGHEAELAIALEEAAAGEAEPYPLPGPRALALDGEFGPEHELDTRPLYRALVADRLAGAPAAAISARFHQSWARALAAAAAAALGETGLRRVVLTGGATHNHRLVTSMMRRLGPDRVLLPRALPPGDGGLSLGQAWAAILQEQEA